MPQPEIVLNDEHLGFAPKEFYIANVIDKRNDRSPFALLLTPVTKDKHQQTIYTADLQGGTIRAIKQFTDHNLSSNKLLRPLVIEIKKFKVTEVAAKDGNADGHIALIMSFNIDRGGDDFIHIGDYNGNTTYARNTGPAQDIEPVLRRLLINGVTYINDVMNQQANTNIKLAKAVKLIFTDYEEKPEGDTIYYTIKRPLTWADFKSKVPSNHFDAEVFPTIGYDEHIDVSKAIINIRLAIKVGIPKSAMWVKEGSKSNYALNHEQRHFDIVKLVAEHFKQRLKTEELPVSNYDGIINVDYLDAYREMNALQKQYDDETRHGMDETEQQRWNEKIDKEFREAGVLK